MQLNKSQTISIDSIDKSNVFLEVYSNSWKTTNKISLDDILKNSNSTLVEFKKYDINNDIDNDTLILNKDTLKVEINTKYRIIPTVHSISFLNQDNDFNTPPKNLQISQTYLTHDDNYLYIWVGNRWKRCLLSIW